jgi:hypothetical protein
MLRRDTLSTSAKLSTPMQCDPAQHENPDISVELVISLSNIITEWSDKNVRKQNQERAFDS